MHCLVVSLINLVMFGHISSKYDYFLSMLGTELRKYGTPRNENGVCKHLKAFGIVRLHFGT